MGTDIVPISRIDNIIQAKGKQFLNRIFSSIEQDICNDKISPSIHYSGKYAAKEAVKKAILSSKLLINISLKSIEIQNDEDGMPFVQIKQNSINVKNLKVSISHAGNYATAIAILEVK